MEILVINGSPKGKNSVTLQTVNYLQLRFPDHNFQLLHAGQTVIEARESLTRPPAAGRRRGPQAECMRATAEGGS